MYDKAHIIIIIIIMSNNAQNLDSAAHNLWKTALRLIDYIFSTTFISVQNSATATRDSFISEEDSIIICILTPLASGSFTCPLACSHK